MKNKRGFYYSPGLAGGMGGGANNTEGGKAQSFGKAIKKLVSYCKPSLVSIIIAFVLSVASVVLTLMVPSLVGDATDALTLEFKKIGVYNAIETTVTDADGLTIGNKTYDTMIGLSEDYETLGDLCAASPEVEAALVAGLGSIDEYRASLMAMPMQSEYKRDLDATIKYLVLALILAVVGAVLGYTQGFILAGVAQKISYRMRRDIDCKVNKLPLKFYDRMPTGDVMSLLTNDVDTISTTLNQSLSQLVTAVTTIVGVIVMMFTISWEMTLVALVLVPLSAFLLMLVVKGSQKFFVKQQVYLAKVNSHIEEMYGGHKEIELYNHQDESIKKFRELNGTLANAAARSQFLSGLMQPVMMFVGNIGYIVVCILGGYLSITTGRPTVGQIQAFLTYMRQFNQPITQLANIVNVLQSTAAASERVFSFLEAENEKETGDKELEPEVIKGAVSFKNVKFGYDPNKIVIHDFSSEIKPGARVAIVGPTGAGKTTMVKLLMRYYDLNGGEIHIDGVPCTDYTRDSLRRGFGMVLQETWLYSGTIMENIRYGRLGATDEEVIAASKMACSDHFIRTLEGGYEFVINEAGDNISQGQKQLLTIARAIIADPKVLILDEATSSVDTRTEKLINQAMDNLMKGRTSFIIAHRLSTIRDADLILVMKDGDIIEQGNHDQLMAQKGFYSVLYNSQFSG